MSAATRHRLLLCAFPRSWRERYGDELEALIVQTETGRGRRLRTALDVLRAGLGERLGAAGLSGDRRPAPERARAWLLVVLCAWSLFVVAGVAVQKTSEHWQRAASGSHRLESAAFLALELLAVAGSVLVLVAIALALPTLIERIRAGEAGPLRRPVLRAGGATLATAAALIPLVLWARDLTPAERNGHDVAYELAVAGTALLGVSSLVAWTAAAVVAASMLALRGRLLDLELCIAGALAGAMAAMTVATIVWSPAADGPRLLVPLALMLVAAVAGATGVAGALRARIGAR